jgi:uncharacterized protein (TIGR00369 family)
MPEQIEIPEPVPVTEGPFAGWSTWMWGADPYEVMVGPFYLREEPNGATRCAILPETRHTNSGGALHGGFLATLADFALFALARKQLRGPAVTVSLQTDYVAPGWPGELLEATGEVIHTTRSMLFVRGVITQKGTPVASFHGLLKRLNVA